MVQYPSSHGSAESPRVESILEWLLGSSLEDASGRLSAYAQRFLSWQVVDAGETAVSRLAQTPGFGWQFADLVRVGFEGPCRGDMVLSLTPQVAGRLAQVLLGDEQAAGDGDCVEGRVLTLMETAQILAYTLLRELSRETGETFFPRPSEFLQDMAASVVQRTASELDMIWQASLRLHTDKEELTCHLALVLSPEMVRLLNN